MMIETYEQQIPQVLVEAFQSAQPPVIFVGSGLGREAVPPVATAEELAAEVCGELKIERNGENLSELLQYMKNSFAGSDADLLLWLQKKLLHGTAAPSCTHRLLLQLPARELLTTNYDHLLTIAASDIRDCSLITVRDPKDWVKTTPPADGATYLGLLHGGFGGQIVATTDDYIKHYKKFGRRWLSLLEEIFRCRVVVFIGYSMRDFTTWTSYISTRLRYGREMRGHYMVSPVAGQHIIDYWRNYGFQFLSFRASDFLIALHRRLNTFYEQPDIAIAAVAAVQRLTFSSAQSHVEASAEMNGHDDVLRSAEALIQEAYR